MTKKSFRRRSASHASTLPSAELNAFNTVYRRGEYLQALQLAETMLKSFPRSAQAWELKANTLGHLDRLVEASEAMGQVVELTKYTDLSLLLKLGQYQVLAGRSVAAVNTLEKVIYEKPDNVKALAWLSRAYHKLGNDKKAIEVNDRAILLDPEDEDVLLWRSRVLDKLKCHDEAVKILYELLRINPNRVGIKNHIATIFVGEGDYKKSEALYEEELLLGPGNAQVYSNLLVAAHYNPEYSAEDLFNKAIEWEVRFSKPSDRGRATTTKDSKKRLRIGLLSGGFRIHPVGQMILPALQHLPENQIELLAYSTSQVVDKLTQKIQKTVHHWEVVEGLSDAQLDRKIREDKIDILIDMNGAGDGSRYTTLTREPAPLIVKWVGGLINTTGLSCFDYLLSDSIETPNGVDRFYTEKLVRLPDDYICYHIPEYAPDVSPLPALDNKYITFGCLNNPAKLSPPMLAEWSVLLKEVPCSKLLLRGIQFENTRYRNKIISVLAGHGISEDRLILEGPAQHREFMATYQRIDIALDTWPYSGGLTTCEALMMGVPVVTRVGPTFAGRHSATHLVNAGLPELVTDSWDDFRARAKELASDLPNLAVIRAALRTILIDSPICDGPRFAKHIATALRAIWQRHCEGKTPEALTFSKTGVARFANEEEPVRLALALPQDGFDWQLESPVLAVDNGAAIAARPDARELLGSGYIVMLNFDPGCKLESVEHLAQYGEIQHFPKTSLGDGQPVTLFAADGVTPTPLAPPKNILQFDKYQIPTVALDNIEGLPSIDLLILNENYNNLTVLKYGTQALSNTLMIQVHVFFQSPDKKHGSFSEIDDWAENNGFRFYGFINEVYRDCFPSVVPKGMFRGAEMLSAHALLLPSHERMESLSNENRMKLAFILSSVYGIDDYAYSLVDSINPDLASKLLEAKGFFTPVTKQLDKKINKNIDFLGKDDNLLGLLGL